MMLVFCDHMSIGHDSTVHIVSFERDPREQTLICRDLPLSVVTFLSPQHFVAAGHDVNPSLFSVDGSGNWRFERKLDERREAVST